MAKRGSIKLSHEPRKVALMTECCGCGRWFPDVELGTRCPDCGQVFEFEGSVRRMASSQSNLRSAPFGRDKDALQVTGDIVAPVAEEWHYPVGGGE